MKALKIVLIFLILTTLVACSTAKRGDLVTLESLEKRSIKVNPQELPSASKVDARQRYKEFATTTENQELRAAAMERLADIELETKQDTKFQEAELKEAEQRARKGKKTAVVDSTKLGDYSNVAKQYEKLIKRYPNSKDNEKLYYQLARAYDLSGQSKKSLGVLTRLMKEFPENKHAEEVQFRRGEIYFSLNDYKNAERSYAYVLSNKDSPYYERSSFYKLFDLHFSGGRRYESFARSEKELVDDTFRVVSLTYSFEQGVKTLKKFSRDYGTRRYEHRIYRELGELYIKQERFKDATNVYASFAEVKHRYF